MNGRRAKKLRQLAARERWRERRNMRRAAQKPSWPGSKDQRQQSRPLIVQRPLRALALRWLETAPRNDKGLRELTEQQKNTLRALSRGMPKHTLDAAARRG